MCGYVSAALRICLAHGRVTPAQPSHRALAHYFPKADTTLRSRGLARMAIRSIGTNSHLRLSSRRRGPRWANDCKCARARCPL